ncbi:MAG TPA: hypothetical protein VLX91_04485 [Candidatus Acidoferrales bacterium]|nr:hypothetical protein [Candidatus Acidoferrales bacterium]
MSFEFKSKDIENIGVVLKVKPVKRGNFYRFDLDDKKSKRKLSVEIYPAIKTGKQSGNLISVYTINSHLQLHQCTGYLASEMLGEVTFYSEMDGKISGLIIEREAGCSLYANVDRSVLSGDFTRFGPEVMLSSIALSLAETQLSAGVKGKSRVSTGS